MWDWCPNLAFYTDADNLGAKFETNINNGRTRVKINHPPEIVAPADTSVGEGESLTFTVAAGDAEMDSMTLVAENLPAGARPVEDPNLEEAYLAFMATRGRTKDAVQEEMTS